jgi:hypothetical protein
MEALDLMLSRIVMATVACMALGALTDTARAGTDEARPVVSAEAYDDELEGEEAVRVDVLIEGADDVGAFEITLAYTEPGFDVAPDSIQRGPFLGSSGREVLCDEPRITAGTIQYACVTLGSEPLEGASGAGLLASAYFVRVPDFEGERDISLANARLNRPMSDEIDVDVRTGGIELPSDGGLNAAIVIVVVLVVVAVLGGAIASGAWWWRRAR